ncbi:hypothetical protein [Duganella sp. Leaf126]|uniref:hypothetical protein n=1 Tax=Duganella sp. Leaf126 TaxID=1736266 RepID=UPI000A4C0962|nr:hypothetical protein [Duganella sp. Leaf126]
MRKAAYILAACAAAWLAWQGVREFAQPQSAAESTAALPAVRQTPRNARPQPVAQALIPPAPAVTSIEDRVHALAASGTPEQYLEAFRFIEKCLQLERDKELANTELHITKTDHGDEVTLQTTMVDSQDIAKIRQSCAGMSGRTRMDRFQLLNYALDHHVAGAMGIYISQGPNGDRNAVQERPADPLVAEWRKHALEKLKAGIASGDVDVMLSSTVDFALLNEEPSPSDRYAIELAANKIIGEINHDDGIFPRAQIQELSKALSQQQQDDALAHAEQIYLNWKRRQHG